MLRIVVSLLMALALTPIAGAQDELDGLRFKYEVEREKLAKPLVDLRAKYKAQLDKLEKKFVAEGALKKVLAARTAATAGDPNPKRLDNEVPEIADLQKIFVREKEQRLKKAELGLEKLHDSYLPKLKKLRASLTKSQKIEEAIAVDGEITRIAKQQKDLRAALEGAWRDPEAEISGDAPPFEKWLETVRFRYDDPPNYYRYLSGKIMARAKPDGTHQPQFRPRILDIDPKEQTIRWKSSSGYEEEIKVSPDRKTGVARTVVGETVKPQGSVTVVPREK